MDRRGMGRPCSTSPPYFLAPCSVVPRREEEEVPSRATSNERNSMERPKRRRGREAPHRRPPDTLPVTGPQLVGETCGASFPFAAEPWLG